MRQVYVCVSDLTSSSFEICEEQPTANLFRQVCVLVSGSPCDRTRLVSDEGNRATTKTSKKTKRKIRKRAIDNKKVYRGQHFQFPPCINETPKHSPPPPLPSPSP